MLVNAAPNRDKILGLSAAPTTGTTADFIGQTALDLTNNQAYMCVNWSGNNYTWKQVSNLNIYSGTNASDIKDSSNVTLDTRLQTMLTNFLTAALPNNGAFTGVSGSYDFNTTSFLEYVATFFGQQINPLIMTISANTKVGLVPIGFVGDQSSSSTTYTMIYHIGGVVAITGGYAYINCDVFINQAQIGITGCATPMTV